MADEKKKAKRVISPKFTAMYAWLSSPNTKHNKDGKYQVSGKFDPKVPEHRAFLKTLMDLWKENVSASRAKFKPTKKDPEMKLTPCMHEEDDGTYRVNFAESAFIMVDDKANPGTQKRIDLKPATVDASGQPTNVEVWSGSIIKVALDVAPFYNGSLGAGLSLRLKGVQVIELRTRGSRDGASLGFGQESGFGNDGSEAAPAGDDFSSHVDGDDFLSDDIDESPGEVAEAPATGTAPKADAFDF